MEPLFQVVAKCINSSHFQARSAARRAPSSPRAQPRSGRAPTPSPPRLTPLPPSLLQVAERALFLWNNDYIVSLVAQNRQIILPIVFGALDRNAHNHWNAAVHGLTCNVRKMFQEMDQQLYDECARKYEEEVATEQQRQQQRQQTWARLEALATQRGGGRAH